MMTFDFYKLYTVTDLGGSFFGEPITQLVIGLLPVRQRLEDGQVLDGIEYRSLSGSEHRLIGTVLREEPGLLELQDTMTGPGGSAVIWQIQRLTYERWNQLGQRGSITGYNYLKATLTDEFTLNLFYSLEFVEDSSWELHAKERGLV
jgi:hypothetical protein